MSDEDKNTEMSDRDYLLFLRQKEMLELFLTKGAISKQQFDKSYWDTKKKMGY